MCDFETTVYKGQVNTEVWASASVELFTEDVKIFHSIEEQFDYFKSLDTNICAYYHNLKFDGAFWLSYLLQSMTPAVQTVNAVEGASTESNTKDNRVYVVETDISSTQDKVKVIESEARY